MDNPYKWKCRCGGEVEIRPQQCALAHSLPACAEYDAIELNELIKTPGALGTAIGKLTIKAQA